jgi:hypothetical protein
MFGHKKFQYLIWVSIPFFSIKAFKIEREIDGVLTSAGGRQFKRIFINI